MVNLKEKPFYLSDDDVMWVENTISEMTLHEKIGQLFIMLNEDRSPDYVKHMISTYHVGGSRYSPGKAHEIYELNKLMQETSKIPLLIAANCDSGGNGACLDGTLIATGAQTAATDSVRVAEQVGFVSGVEASAIGCNWNFGPTVDILFNWRNTIVNTRAYGRNTDRIIALARGYINGLSKSGMASCIKHFPGDGVEERDQHLVMGVNDLSCEQWDKSFGMVYKTLIDDGIMSIMAGHIALPSYSKMLIPHISDEDIMPATLAQELITGLLRNKLGFNGLVLTDASHMLGLTASMPRHLQLPCSIAAGCDMFLFFNDPEEDFSFMLDGYKSGIITEERLRDALYRILGMKAALKLHKKKSDGTLIPNPGGLEVIGCSEHLKLADDAADLSITLVKNTKDQLPITPQTHKRIKLYYLKGDMGGIHCTTNEAEQIVIEELERAGFEVSLNDGSLRTKGKINEYKAQYDAAFVFANITGYASENTMRIKWSVPMSNEVPWYSAEIPTVFVSLNFTTHLHDVPMVKTFINAYAPSRTIIRRTIEKIMGKSKFNGVYDENVWCGKWSTRL